MSTLKTIGRAIGGLLAGGLTYYFWDMTRPGDPYYYSIGAAVVVAIMTFLILHFVGKES